MADSSLTEQTLEAVRNLRIIPDMVGNSSLSGIHSSEQKGSDVEFAEHRQYEPGDDLRYLDWNALAKTDELYLKQFESETTINSLVLLDASNSMNFTTGELTKWELARGVSILLSSILLQQQDQVQLIPSGGQTSALPPWHSMAELQDSIEQVETFKPEGENILESQFKQALSNSNQKKLWIIISDFWLLDTEEFFDRIRALKTRGHDIILVPVWDALERQFDLDQTVELEDLETGETISLSGSDLESFQEALREQRNRYRRIARENQIRFWPFFNDRDLLESLRDNLNDSPIQ